MAKNKWRVGAALQGNKRALLLRMFRPKFSRVYCQSLTYAYGVGPDYTFPEDNLDVRITGIHRTDTTEALVCTVNGQTHRPDGQRFHITLSTDGAAPATAGDIDDARIEPVNPVLVSFLRCTREKLRPAKCEHNAQARAAA